MTGWQKVGPERQIKKKKKYEEGGYMTDIYIISGCLGAGKTTLPGCMSWGPFLKNTKATQLR